MRRPICLLMILTGCFTAAFQQTVSAQDTSKTTFKDRKNTINFNLTNAIISGGKSIIFGYERIINNKQSFSVNLGTASFPSLDIINSDSIKAETIRDEKGYNFSADYRFYLAKENKYKAPRGVYIGPYYSYNYFDKKHGWAINTQNFEGTVNTDLSLGFHTIGAELGYQFVFWDRLSVNMILLGPGVAFYKLKLALTADMPQEDKEKMFEMLNNALAERFPSFDKIINEGDFEKTGTSKTTSLGYRYMVQIGFRF